MPHWILDDEGQPIQATFEEWGAWFQDHSKRVLAQQDEGNYWVSTVFLGVEDERWETMVFCRKSHHEQFMKRYLTRDEALRGHKEAVRWARDHSVWRKPGDS